MTLVMDKRALWIWTRSKTHRWLRLKPYPYGQWGRSIYTLPNFGMKFTVYSN